MANQMQRWLAKGAAAVVDQTISAALVFGVNIFVARSVPEREYGLFALLYAIVVLANMLHNAIVTEPMMVYRGRLTEAQFDRGLALFRGTNLRFALAASIVGTAFATICGLLGYASWATSSIVVGLAIGALAFLWFARKACYAKLDPAGAVKLAAAHCAITIGLLAGGRGVGWESAHSTIALMSIGGILAVWIVTREHFGRRQGGEPTAEIGHQMVPIGRYGRHAVPGAILNWLTGNAFYIALPLVVGLEEGALFRSVMNLYLPFQHILLSLSVLVITPLAIYVREGIDAEIRKKLCLRSLVVVSIGGVYGLLSLWYGRNVIAALYGGAYLAGAEILRFGFLLPIAWALVAASATILRALDQPGRVSVAYAFGAVAVGTWLIPYAGRYGATGAMVGYVIMQGVTGIMGFGMLLAPLLGALPEPATRSPNKV